MCLRIFWHCWRDIFKLSEKSKIILAHTLTSSETEFAGIYREIPRLRDVDLE